MHSKAEDENKMKREHQTTVTALSQQVSKLMTKLVAAAGMKEKREESAVLPAPAGVGSSGSGGSGGEQLHSATRRVEHPRYAIHSIGDADGTDGVGDGDGGSSVGNGRGGSGGEHVAGAGAGADSAWVGFGLKATEAELAIERTMTSELSNLVTALESSAAPPSASSASASTGTAAPTAAEVLAFVHAKEERDRDAFAAAVADWRSNPAATGTAAEDAGGSASAAAAAAAVAVTGTPAATTTMSSASEEEDLTSILLNVEIRQSNAGGLLIRYKDVAMLSSERFGPTFLPVLAAAAEVSAIDSIAVRDSEGGDEVSLGSGKFAWRVLTSLEPGDVAILNVP